MDSAITVAWRELLVSAVKIDEKFVWWELV